MRKLIIILPLIAACYISLATAQRFAPGYCPTVTAHENFDKTKVSLINIHCIIEDNHVKKRKI